MWTRTYVDIPQRLVCCLAHIGVGGRFVWKVAGYQRGFIH